MTSSLADTLGKSGVKYRCECGVESQFQREAKLPKSWTLTFRVVGERSWPAFICPECRGDGRHTRTKDESLESWRRRGALRKGRKR